MRKLLTITIIAILLFSATIVIAKEIKNEIIEAENQLLTLRNIENLYETSNFKISNFPTNGECNNAIILTLGEKSSMSTFNLETSNQFRQMLINWYMNGLLWKILPKYQKQISLKSDDVLADISYSVEKEGGYITWIINVTTLGDYIKNLDPEDLQDPEIMNTIMENSTEYMNGGTSHSIQVTYSPYKNAGVTISDTIFYIAKAILLKLTGIGQMYGFGSTYCQVSWSE